MATFYNQAILSYNNNVTNSNIVSGELLEVLSATKTAVPGTYKAGDDVTYVVSIVNSGAAAYPGLTVSDNLGSYSFGSTSVIPLTYVAGSIRYYVNGVLQSAPSVTAGPPLNITGITVPANGNVILVYSASVNAFAPLGAGSSIINTVTVSGGGLSTPVTATDTISADGSANLSITKSVNPPSVVENGELTYTFVIQNYGNTEADAADNVALQDTFDPILAISSVTFNGTPWSSPTQYTYNTGTGEFSTVAGAITVPAATYTQDEISGSWTTNPGISIVTVTGTV